MSLDDKSTFVNKNVGFVFQEDNFRRDKYKENLLLHFYMKRKSIRGKC